MGGVQFVEDRTIGEHHIVRAAFRPRMRRFSVNAAPHGPCEFFV